MNPLILFCFLFFQTDVPYKTETEFSVKFNLTFKKRAEAPHKDWVASDAAAPVNESPDSNSPLPFMQVSLEVLTKLPDEVKLRIVNSEGKQILKKKIDQGMKQVVFSEFVDDITADASDYNHTIYFLNKEGDSINKIVIEFDEEGFYLVNGKKKGKL